MRVTKQLVMTEREMDLAEDYMLEVLEAVASDPNVKKMRAEDGFRMLMWAVQSNREKAVEMQWPPPRTIN